MALLPIDTATRDAVASWIRICRRSIRICRRDNDVGGAIAWQGALHVMRGQLRSARELVRLGLYLYGAPWGERSDR